jgi:hypothetical protein
MAPHALNFNAFMEKEKLATNGSNFTNWTLNLRILLNVSQKGYVLEAPLHNLPAEDAPDEEKNVFLTHKEDHSLVHCSILYGLELELRKCFENSNAYDTMGELKLIFNSQTARESYDASEKFFSCRLGHIGVKHMKKLHLDGLLELLDYESFETCEPCLMGKMTRTPFFGSMERAIDLLEIIHTDVCGPMSVSAHGGYHYFVTFTNDLSRYGYIYLMKHKSETFEKFKEFQSEVENHHNRKIKFL